MTENYSTTDLPGFQSCLFDVDEWVLKNSRHRIKKPKEQAIHIHV